jgi:hypothetical protein
MPTTDRTKQILTLEELATELLGTARQLPPGAERHDILKGTSNNGDFVVGSPAAVA